MFSGFPVEKLSRTVTSLFCARSVSTRFEPMKPAPPVTRRLLNARGDAGRYAVTLKPASWNVLRFRLGR